jgi:hypothetical protein
MPEDNMETSIKAREIAVGMDIIYISRWYPVLKVVPGDKTILVKIRESRKTGLALFDNDEQVYSRPSK